ncbi:MAG: TonB-dependent receptor [Bacteroidota bacterium]
MRKLIVLITVAMAFMLPAIAQDRSVSGRITDEKGTPLQSVSVTSPDGKFGTQTDANGNYKLTLPPTVTTLSFSTVDFVPVSRSLGKSAEVSFSMTSTDKSLSEVVVVGYGTQQKKSFTGSASKVDVKQFANLVTPSVDKQLAGRAAGVQVTNQGGSVNTPARIRVRGTNSINQSNDPLIVIDGIPVISGNLSATTNSNTLGDINPADIETIDVLKDGSATAIYGSRGAPGVILITTKKGTKGRNKVTYDGFVGFNNALKKFDLLNASQFVTIANEKRTNAGLSLLAGTNTAAPSYNTDWQNEVMIDNAPVHSHTLSMQGGTEKTTYYFSLNYSDQKGIIISNYNRAFRARMNVEHEANKFFKFGNNINISRQEDGDQNNGANSLGGAIAASLRLLPNVSPKLETGWEGFNINYPTSGTMTQGANAQTVDDNFNNVAYTIRKNKYYSDKYRIINNSFAEISPVKGLKIRTQVGADILNDYAYQGLNLYHGDGYTVGGVFNQSQNWLRLVWTSYFNYSQSIKGHTFNLTGGYEAQKETYKFFSANGSVLSDAFYISENVITNSASTQVIGGNYDVRGFVSTFGRLNYDYKNRYFLQGSVRRDGQSALAADKQYGVFPGVSVGWRPSEESFWKNSGFGEAINDFKIKASYAKVGNTLGGYPYLSTFGNRPYGNLSGLGPTAVGNNALQWETSTKYDVGIDMTFLKNRLTFTADYFLNDVDNLVLDVPTPLSAGVPGSTGTSGGGISQNIGTLQNAGIELSLGGNVVRGNKFSWDVNINYSKVKNEIKSLYSIGGVPVEQIENGVYNIIKVGQPINVIFGYENAGVNSENGNPMFYKADGSLIQLSLAPGATVGRYYTAKSMSDGTLGAVSSLAAADKKILGQGVPTWFGAFTNTFNYDRLSLEVMFRYSGGNKIMNYTRQEVLFNMSFQNNGSEILDRWTTPGQVTDVPKIYYGQGANINSTNSATSRFVESGDYLKLQNVVLSYALSNSKLESVTRGYVKSAKFYVQGQNLAVWTKYKGADPDNISALGIDAAVSPQLRTIAFGLSVGF